MTGLRTLQDFVGMPGRLSGYSMALDDYQQAWATKAALRTRIHEGEVDLPLERGFYVRTWEEHNENLLKAVAMEKALIRMMTFLIVLAAIATIFLTLFMAVHTKVREFGILRALGGTPPGVLGLFVGQGVWIAVTGMAAGLGLGVLFATWINEIAAWQQRYTGWHPFPPDVYYLDKIPTRIDVGENLQNFLITLLFGALAALFPGLLAAFRPPLRALRHE
jgi:lipoprotein-releasing system permease protein